MHPPLGACGVWTHAGRDAAHPTPSACMCARRYSKGRSLFLRYGLKGPRRVRLVEMSCAKLMHPPLGACGVWTHAGRDAAHPTPSACMCARRYSKGRSSFLRYGLKGPRRVRLVEMSCAQLHASTLGCLWSLDACGMMRCGAPHTPRLHVCKALQQGAVIIFALWIEGPKEGEAG